MKSLSKLEDNSIHRQYIPLFLCLFSPCVTSGNWQKKTKWEQAAKKKKKKKITNNSTTGMKGINLPETWEKCRTWGTGHMEKNSGLLYMQNRIPSKLKLFQFVFKDKFNGRLFCLW